MRCEEPSEACALPPGRRTLKKERGRGRRREGARQEGDGGRRETAVSRDRQGTDGFEGRARRLRGPCRLPSGVDVPSKSRVSACLRSSLMASSRGWRASSLGPARAVRAWEPVGRPPARAPPPPLRPDLIDRHSPVNTRPPCDPRSPASSTSSFRSSGRSTTRSSHGSSTAPLTMPSSTGRLPPPTLSPLPLASPNADHPVRAQSEPVRRNRR